MEAPQAEFLRRRRCELVSLFQWQQSCRGLLSRAQEGAFTVHYGTFLLWPGRNDVCEADRGILMGLQRLIRTFYMIGSPAIR